MAKETPEQKLARLQAELEQVSLELKGQKAVPKGKGDGGTFVLLEGGHVGDDGKEYTRGAKIQANSDLVLRFGAEKFKRVGEPVKRVKKADEVVDVLPVIESPPEVEDVPPAVPTPENEPDFDAMTVSELKEYAADNEIDLGNLSKRADILAKVKKG